MPLKIKLSKFEVTMPEYWISEDEYQKIVSEKGPEAASDYMKELVQEDILSFYESLDILDHAEFYWSSK